MLKGRMHGSIEEACVIRRARWWPFRHPLLRLLSGRTLVWWTALGCWLSASGTSLLAITLRMLVASR